MDVPNLPPAEWDLTQQRGVVRLSLLRPVGKESRAPGRIPPVPQLHAGFGSGFGSSRGLTVPMNSPFCAASFAPGPWSRTPVGVCWLRRGTGSGRARGGCPRRGSITSLECLWQTPWFEWESALVRVSASLLISSEGN